MPNSETFAKISAEQMSVESENRWLLEALGLPEPETPFPWQEELLARFRNGVIERSLDLPTGLGKTAVMAIWLVARAHGANLPRRLVYVVDRRAVVDQENSVAQLKQLCSDDSLPHPIQVSKEKIPWPN